MMKRKIFFPLVLVLTIMNSQAQQNMLGVYFSDLVRFPGMEQYFNDERWISAFPMITSRNYNRFGFGIQYQRIIGKTDWVLSLKAGMGIRTLHEYYDYEVPPDPDPSSTNKTITEKYDARFKQQNFSFIPGIYYKIDNGSRITGHGGLELLLTKYGNTTTQGDIDGHTVTVIENDPTDTSGMGITREDLRNISFEGKSTGGMAVGLGFVAGLKVKLTESLIVGIDISEYFSYLKFKGTNESTTIDTYQYIERVNGNVYETAPDINHILDRNTISYQQFSFSNVVASLNVSFAF